MGGRDWFTAWFVTGKETRPAPLPERAGFGEPTAHRQSRVVVVPSLVFAPHWPWAKLVPSPSHCVLTSFF